MEPTIFEEKPEQAILVALDTGEYDVEASLAELEELAHTAGAQVLGALVQKRESPEQSHLPGKRTAGGADTALPQRGGGSGDLRPGADRHPAPQPGKRAPLPGGGPHRPDSGYFRRPRPLGGGAASSGAGAATISAAPTRWTRRVPVSSGGRHWHPRPRRNQAGKRPAAYPPADPFPASPA